MDISCNGVKIYLVVFIFLICVTDSIKGFSLCRGYWSILLPICCVYICSAGINYQKKPLTANLCMLSGASRSFGTRNRQATDLLLIRYHTTRPTSAATAASFSTWPCRVLLWYSSSTLCTRLLMTARLYVWRRLLLLTRLQQYY